MQRLTITHVRRWQQHRGYAGLGHVYQGRYKSFPVESDEHFWVVARYVSAMRFALNSFFERRNGDGRVCGDNVTARRRSAPCWRRGRSSGPRIGSSGSIRRTTTRNWNRSAKACSEAARSASQSGRSKSPNDWAWSRPFVPVVARGKWVDPKTAFKRKNARWCTRLPSLSISYLSRFPLSIVPVPLPALFCGQGHGPSPLGLKP